MRVVILKPSNNFMAQGLITEKNLDRFDTTCLTWRHPALSRERLSELLFDCYHQFFSLGHALRNAKNELRFRGRRFRARVVGGLSMSLFSRYCAWRRTHPMSGGIRRVRLDGVDDFLSLRKEAFGFGLAPLPRSLQLPAAESRLNQATVRRRRTSLTRAPDTASKGGPILRYSPNA